jgi:hypothetical protein
MSGDNAVAIRSRQLLFDRLVTGRENETVDAGHPSANDRETAPSDLKLELSRERVHPDAAFGIYIPVGIGIPLP